MQYQKMMEKEVPKKTGVIFLLIAIVLAATITVYILNYVQAPKVTNAEVKESNSGGEISLTVKKPPIIIGEDKGSLSLTVLPAGG